MGKQKLIGRVAIITGAASGIGRSTVELFLNEGAKVIGFDMNPETSNALTKRVAEQGFDSNFHMRLGDVADEADIASTVEFAKDTFGKVDIMFNNAGLGGAFGPIVKTDVEHWDATFAINMRGVFLGTKYAAMAMVESRRWRSDHQYCVGCRHNGFVWSGSLLSGKSRCHKFHTEFRSRTWRFRHSRKCHLPGLDFYTHHRRRGQGAGENSKIASAS